jgi:hypothetical protein
MSQYCRFNSAGDSMVRYLTFREQWRVEAQECRAAKKKGKMAVGDSSLESCPAQPSPTPPSCIET